MSASFHFKNTFRHNVLTWCWALGAFTLSAAMCSLTDAYCAKPTTAVTLPHAAGILFLLGGGGCTPQLAGSQFPDQVSMAPERLTLEAWSPFHWTARDPEILPFDNHFLKSDTTILQYKWTNAIPRQVYVDKTSIQFFLMKKEIYFHKKLINKTNQKIKEMNIFSKFYYNAEKKFYMKI